MKLKRFPRLTAAALVCVLAGAPAASPRLSAQTVPATRVGEPLVRAHMEMLASDALRGRGSGTQDEWIAATYVGAELRRLGLEPLGDDSGFVQRVQTARQNLVRPPRMSIGDSVTYSHGAEILVTAFGPPRVSGPLVRLRGDAPAPPGSIVIVSGSTPPDPGLVAQAVAVLVRESPQIRARWQTIATTTRVASAANRPWRVTLNEKAFAIATETADGTTVALEAELEPAYTWNVVGRIPGRDPRRAGESILLSAHLDHLGVRGTGIDTIYNGADDDASGVTAVLALAASLASPRPRRSILVALFGSEETGGDGAAQFIERPPAPLESIVANLEFEMIGRPDPAVPRGTLWLTGFERTTLGPTLAAHGARLVADPHPAERFFERSDNIQLARRGVVAQTVSSFGLHRDYHQPSDELSGIDFAHLTRAIQSLVRPVRWLADSTYRPEWRPNMQPAPRPQAP
jgi:hypothetical protein